MWLHCNKCGVLKSENKATKFFALLCSHVLCEECNLAETCPIHNRPVKGIEINKAMPQKMLSFFMDPNTFLTSWQKCIRFQCEQRTLLEIRQWKEITQETKNIKKEIEVLKKLKEQAMATIEKDTECINKMKVCMQKMMEHEREINEQETNEEQSADSHSPNNTMDSSSSTNCSSLGESGVDMNFDEFESN